MGGIRLEGESETLLHQRVHLVLQALLYVPPPESPYLKLSAVYVDH